MNDLSAWALVHLGSPVAEVLHSTGHLSWVELVRLADGRRVVIKIRPADARLDGCAYVQRHLFAAGFPCPEPLTGPMPFEGGTVASAEMVVEPVEWVEPAEIGAQAFAELLAELIRRAPDPDATPPLGESPPWAAWNHHYDGVWPPADDRDADLNAHPETAWLDDLGRAVRVRLSALADELGAGSPRVIGHCDFESHNIEWLDRKPYVVHDWDSVICDFEPVIVGIAAAMWSAGRTRFAATLEQSTAFLDAYLAVAGREWTPDEIGASWAAGLWVRAFNAKKAALDGLDWLDRAEAAERSRLSGMG